MGHNQVVKGLVFVVMVAAGARWATADDIMGEYEGTFIADKTVTLKASADVVAEGDGYYRIVLDAPGKEGRAGAFVEVYGRKFKQEVVLIGQAGGYHWSGEIARGVLVAKSAYGQSFELKKIKRTSPTEGSKPPEGAVVLLPYEPGTKTDASLWTNRKWKVLDDGSMQCTPRTGPNRTSRQFSQIKHLHLEFKLPLEPSHRGQHRANSGVYLLDAYEVQVLDSFGLVHTSGDCGGLYGIARARVNACLPPETWQTYDITFQPAELDGDGEVTALPWITVLHNGVKIHDRQEIPKKRHRTRGPLQLQDHGHNIQFRNIWLVEGK